jgi:hypothetical protein
MKRDKSDLWIIGDSFTESSPLENYWTDILMKNFNGENRYLNSGPGRDIQTTMDLFYKNLHNISDTSLVIIFLPSVARLRYPKKEKYFKDFMEVGWRKHLDDNTEHNFKEYFINHPYADDTTGEAREELDFPFDKFNLNKLNNTNLITYNYKNEQERFEEAIDDISCMDFAKLLNTNTATLNNWNDIFFSIKKAFPFKVLFYSWTDEYDIESVLTKKAITNLVGYWHTQHDDFRDTHGSSGILNDGHFSLRMHKGFADLVMLMNKTYFK